MNSRFVLLTLISLFATALYSDTGKYVITVPVADLRAQQARVPAEAKAPAMSRDLAGQVSQLLLGERITLNTNPSDEGLTDAWIHINAPEQKIVKVDETLASESSVWQGCPGYVEKRNEYSGKQQLINVDEFVAPSIVLQELWTPLYATQSEDQIITYLACGTALPAKKIDDQWWEVTIPSQQPSFIKAADSVYQIEPTVELTQDQLRQQVVYSACQFIGAPYVWGGRSPKAYSTADTTQIMGTDCSDLVNIAYRTCGLRVPKNSTSQFYRAPVAIQHGKDLLPGDLLFFTTADSATSKFPHMRHVMIYIGNDELIESTGQGFSSIADVLAAGLDQATLGVRLVKAQDYLGVSIDQIESGKTMRAKSTIYMASYLSNKDFVQTMRSAFIDPTQPDAVAKPKEV